VRTSGLAEAVDFCGYLDDQALQARLRECALFALPSQREGFGLVFLEAMAQAPPCLAARAGGAPEVVTDETGMLAPSATSRQSPPQPPQRCNAPGTVTRFWLAPEPSPIPAFENV
jgi:glycosyltransferase involved in cell wall biosynthesis